LIEKKKKKKETRKKKIDMFLFSTDLRSEVNRPFDQEKAKEKDQIVT